MPYKKGDKLRIYFATNRNPTGPREKPTFGERFNEDGPHFYEVGAATAEKVSNDLDEGYKVVKVELFEGDKDEPDEAKRLGSTKAFKEIRREMAKNARDAIILLHGFANTFEDVFVRAAQLQEFYRIPPKGGSGGVHPILFAFCWPSNGKVEPPWQYFSDRDDAKASGTAMARAIMRFIDFMADPDEPRCKRKIHLVAHSMGNWALRHAVQGLKELNEGRSLQTLFENVFLMAADEDDDTLELDHKLGPLREMARRVHVYHSNDDGALVISRTTKFNPDRLGFNGPRTFSGLSTRIVAIDCEDVDDTESLQVNHQYYRRRPEVIRDVQAVLSGKRPSDIPGRVEVEPGRRYKISPKDKDKPKLKTPKNPEEPDNRGR